MKSDQRMTCSHSRDAVGNWRGTGGEPARNRRGIRGLTARTSWVTGSPSLDPHYLKVRIRNGAGMCLRALVSESQPIKLL